MRQDTQHGWSYWTRHFKLPLTPEAVVTWDGSCRRVDGQVATIYEIRGVPPRGYTTLAVANDPSIKTPILTEISTDADGQVISVYQPDVDLGAVSGSPSALPSHAP